MHTKPHLARLESLALRRGDIADGCLILHLAIGSLSEDTNLRPANNKGVAFVANGKQTVLLSLAERFWSGRVVVVGVAFLLVLLVARL
jgi:hypothetical protein